MSKGVFTEREADGMTRINELKKELETMRYILHEYDDFWEWYEDEYGETKREVFEKYDKHCEKQDLATKGINTKN